MHTYRASEPYSHISQYVQQLVGIPATNMRPLQFLGLFYLLGTHKISQVSPFNIALGVYTSCTLVEPEIVLLPSTAVSLGAVSTSEVFSTIELV